MDRRRFIARAAALGGSVATGMALPGTVSTAGAALPGATPIAGKAAAATSSDASSPGAKSPVRRLRILILGGTGFIGPHQVRAVLERGHELTLFNRGRSNPGLFPEIETLIGDRDGDLRALEGRRWDCVIDNSGYEPQQMELSAGLLRDSVDLYLFVSTQSVYADRSIIDQDETGAVGMPGVPESEWRGYGPLKALCEKELRTAMPDRSTILRPAVIVGPGDTTDRFTYWVQRVDRGGEVLAPGDPEDPTQFIDVRDIAEWTVRLLESPTTGTYNVTGPEAELPVAGMLYGIRAVTTSPVRFTWTSREFLAEQGVRAFQHLPLWMPPVGATAGFLRMSARRARSAGLTYRPLAVTAGDTLDWWRSEPESRRHGSLRAGLSPEREMELLAAWRARAGRSTG